MKKTLILSLFILLGYFATDRLVFAGLRFFDNHVYTGQTSGKVNQFLKVKDSVNTLVFGSSRANHHVDILQLDSVGFNMGVDATKIAYAAALIETLTKNNQQIFVHIDPYSLLDPNNEYKGEDCLNLINLADREEGIRKSIGNLYPEELILTAFSKSYMYNGKSLGFLKNYFKPSYDYKNYHGYDPLIPGEAQKQVFLDLWKTEGKDSIGYKNSNSINPVVKILIENIKKKCADNRSQLVFFTSPTLNQINPEIISATNKFFQSLGIVYFDYTYLFQDFNPDYWKDLTHLSATGAKEFTKKMKSDVFKNNKSPIN